MIYSIAARVFYANNQLKNATYAFQKAEHLNEEDLFYLGISYLKLFQRFLEKKYLQKAIQTFSKIAQITDRIKKILEAASLDEEIKTFVELHTKPISKNYQPIVNDIYEFLKERGKIYPKKSIERYWLAALRQTYKDPVMLTQMVIYSLHKRIPLEDISADQLIKEKYFPLKYNPLKLPHILKRYLDRVYSLDYEVYSLSLLSPHLKDKIEEKKEMLHKHLKKVYHPIHIYFPTDESIVLYSNIIKCLRSIPLKEKWDLLSKY